LIDAYTNQSRGMAFVRYTTPDEARSAIQSLNNYLIPGFDKPLIVKFADTEDERTQRKQKQQRRRMQSQRYGYADGAGVMPMNYPPMNGMYGAGVAGFTAPMASPFGYPSAAGYPPMYPYPYPPPYSPDTNPPTAVFTTYSHPNIVAECNLFVSGLPDDVDDNLLYRVFGAYGSIVSVRVQRERITQQPKGFGFVQMSTPAEAQAAVQALNGATLGNKVLYVSLKK